MVTRRKLLAQISAAIGDPTTSAI
ncbi:hypothetical protein BOSE21B_50399 [Bosea sp. 21B]|nr:hypothetical protein BOSE21B_50399 [Bosea sp. 21B]